MPVDLGERIAAFGQLVAKSFAQSHLFDERDHAVGITKSERLADLAFRDDAFFIHLHSTGDGHADRDSIHAIFVAQVVRFGDSGQIVHAASAAQRADGFVFWPFTFSPS